MTDWIEQTACASRPSSFSLQETCEPIPGTSPKARTSNLPPSDSFSLRRRSISSTIASETSASRQRTGESSTPSKSSGASSSRSGAVTEAIWITWLWTLTPTAERKPFAIVPAATRAAVSRALARSRTLRTSVKPYFCSPARSACPGRGRCDSSTSASTGQGFIRSSQFG